MLVSFSIFYLREKLLNTIVEQGLNVGKSEELIDLALSKETGKTIRRRNAYKDIKSFYIAIDRAVDGVKNSGVNIKSRRVENDEYVELTILISKESSDTNNVIA